MSENITRPIIGIENRTAQEVFDIMVARIEATPAPSHKPGGTSVANFEAHLTRILEEYEQRREAIQEDEEVKDRFIILRAFELAVAAREDQP